MIRSSQHPAVESEPQGIGITELEQALHTADPSAILAPPRILRRVIKQAARVRGFGLRVPHRKTYVIARPALLAIVEPAELDLHPDVVLADRVILLARPTSEQLEALAAPEALAKYWRLLFHARVHEALDQAVNEERLTEAVVQQRIQQIGLTEFDEVRAVLRQEDMLLPPKDDMTTYIEFVAVFLELQYFVPSFLRDYFPSMLNFNRVAEILKQDIDADGLFHDTRLPGAGDPATRGETMVATPAVPPPDEPTQPADFRARRSAQWMAARAASSAAVGNLVRAAILRTRAARLSHVEVARNLRADAQTDLERLAQRLQAALSFTLLETKEWTTALTSLLGHAARGIWTAEARLLYDLQKVCVDHERGVYSLNLAQWVTSFGRAPLKRLLPGQRDVLICKHLRHATRRLSAARLSNRGRARLGGLLQSAVHRAEESLRARFRPLIESELDHVDLTPHNVPERVARKKLIDELLDRIVERGFLSMGDLRDALSRNNLKLPDLASVRQFLLGDQLLQADRRLAGRLDGVYRRGEIYLRLPQRLSSLAFGTPVGRFLTRYAAVPFGGAYVTIEFLSHLISRFTEHHTNYLPVLPSVLLLGSFLLGLLCLPRFRGACLEAVRGVGRTLRAVCIDLPALVLQLPIVRAIVESVYFRLLQQFAFKPLLVSAIVAGLMAFVFRRQTTLESALVTFVIVNLLLNSRIGRNVDEVLTDWAVHTWHRLRIRVFAALFRWIIDVFNRLLETIERLLYTVDEWLRFRAGEGFFSTLAKAILGVVWAVVNYVIRIYVNLLIEPQVNPIKHFPVVTVSHKIILPLSRTMTRYMAQPLVPFIGPVAANGIAGPTVFLLPGLFGFLFWELKENWRLYAANRPTNLQTVSIGHHGETMIQFLRPGFRSGTLPKLYTKLRHANRKAYWTLKWKASGKYLEAIDRVSERVRWFVDRDLLMLLKESHGWGGRQIATGEIQLGTNRILVELYCPELDENSLWIAFEEDAGWLVASVFRRGWLDKLDARQCRTLANALAGLYKMAGVDLVREQIEAVLELSTHATDALHRQTAARSDRDVSPPRTSPPVDWTLPDQGTARRPSVAENLPTQGAEWVFGRTPIAWHRWVQIWELDEHDAVEEPVLDASLLPHGLSRA